MTNALEVRGLRKSYGEKAVLKGIDLSVGRGDIFALLGVNGAGKTTALACIEGLRKYDGGTISVNGRIGIQLQSAALPAHIKGGEAVRLFAKWNRKPADTSMLAALGVYVWFDRMKWYSYLFLMLLNVGVYLLTRSKTSMLITAAFILGACLFTFVKGLRKKTFFYVCGLLVFLLCIAFSVDAAVCASG